MQLPARLYGIIEESQLPFAFECPLPVQILAVIYRTTPEYFFRSVIYPDIGRKPDYLIQIRVVIGNGELKAPRLTVLRLNLVIIYPQHIRCGVMQGVCRAAV